MSTVNGKMSLNFAEYNKEESNLTEWHNLADYVKLCY